MASAKVEAKLLYSASTELGDIVGCYFSFHDISKSPNFTKYPVTDFLVVG